MRAQDIRAAEIDGWPASETWKTGRVIIPETDAERAQLLVLEEALRIYSARNEEYRDNWKRMGWRGALIRIRERAERLWDTLWDAPGFPDDEEDDSEADKNIKRLDDAYDLINFAGFLIRGVKDGNRDGSWWS